MPRQRETEMSLAHTALKPKLNGMKRFLVWMAAGGWGISLCFAQLSVEVNFDNEVYIPNEALVAKIRIINNSGKALKFGVTDDWLVLNVETENERVVSMIKPPAVFGEFLLESSQVGVKRIDLAPCFNLSNPGRFKITASVRIPEWNQSFVSKSKHFDIVGGVRFFETSFGLPNSTDSGKDAQPEIRKYILQQVSRKQTTLYVRITDSTETKTFKVIPIGVVLSLSKPEPQIDRWSNLHLLLQVGARAFSYTVITATGQILVRETWDYTTSRPILKSGDEGRISVVGGIRRPTPNDLPPPETNPRSQTAVPAAEPPKPTTDAKPIQP